MYEHEESKCSQISNDSELFSTLDLASTEIIGKLYLSDELKAHLNEMKAKVINEDEFSIASGTHIEHDYLFKVIVVGDASVGKTSLLHRLQTKEYSEHTKATVGVEHQKFEMILNEVSHVKL